MPTDDEIRVNLANDFNEAAAKPVLDRFGATLTHRRRPRGEVWTWVEGITPDKTNSFMKEFIKVKGVKCVWVVSPH